MNEKCAKKKALTKFTNQSSVALDELKKEAAKEKIPFRKLKNPPETRWSGRFENLNSVLHLKRAIQTMCDEKCSWE